MVGKDVFKLRNNPKKRMQILGMIKKKNNINEGITMYDIIISSIKTYKTYKTYIKLKYNIHILLLYQKTTYNEILFFNHDNFFYIIIVIIFNNELASF